MVEPGRVGPRHREVRSDRRMSDVEAMMWNVEKDPHLQSTYGSVTIVDRHPEIGHLRRRVLRMVDRLPRLHQRVVPAFAQLTAPEWRDDPDFDMDYHLRHVALPGRGTERQLFDLAMQIVHDPFDRTRPLWEFVVVDGLEGGRSALIQKMHHTIADGAGAIRMSEQFIDTSRDAPDIEEITITAEAAPDASLFDSAAGLAADSLRRSFDIAVRAASETATAVRHPDRWAELTRLPFDFLDIVNATVHQIGVMDGAHSPVWTQRSLLRSFEALEVDFETAHRASRSLGGSLNDFFVTGAARAACAYHRARGAEVETLRMAMPVSTRLDKAAGGNSFVPTRKLVPIAIDDPGAHFAAVHEVLKSVGDERVLGAVLGVAGLARVLPTSVLVRLARHQVETVDFTTSNVRAASFDLFLAGSLILATYPIGPLGGTAFNLTMMSYRGALQMGLHVDAGAVDDAELLKSCLIESYAALIAAGLGS